jgi:hypothetical protein
VFRVDIPIELIALFALGALLVWLALVRQTSDDIEGNGEERWRFRR